MSEHTDKLKAMQESWSTVQDEKKGIPDGVYYLQCESAVIMENKDGDLMILVQHIVLDGEFTGQRKPQWMNFNDRGLSFIYEWLYAMGRKTPEELHQIEPIVKEINNANPTYHGRFKTTTSKKNGQEYQNVYIDELVESAQSNGSKTTTKTKTKTKAKPKKAKKGKAASEKTEGWEDYDLHEKVHIVDTETGEIIELKIQKWNKDTVMALGSDGSSWNIELSDLVEEPELEVEEVEEVEEEAPKPVKTPKKTKATKKNVSSPMPTFSVVDMFEFAQTHGIEVSDQDSIVSIKEKVRNHEWDTDEMTPGETKVLEFCGS